MTKFLLLIAALSCIAPLAVAQVRDAGPRPAEGQSVGNMAGNSAATMEAGSGSIAHSPGTINPSNYKTETECLNAAAAARASMDACKSIPKK